MNLSDYIVKNGSGVQWKDGETVKLTGETVFTPASGVSGTGVIDYGHYNDNVARWPYVSPGQSGGLTGIAATTVASPVPPVVAHLMNDGRVRLRDVVYFWREDVGAWVVDMAETHN